MNKFHHDFFSAKVQEINALPDGTITRSNNSLFNVESGGDLYEIHPFFESLRDEILRGKRSYLAFPCVQLDLNGTILVCDITIKLEREFLAILLFDYTAHYQTVQRLAQEKNLALLNEQRKRFENEREAFRKFTNNGSELFILNELERVIVLMEQLRATPLDNKQAEILHEMDSSLGVLYHKALQINAGVDMDFD